LLLLASTVTEYCPLLPQANLNLLAAVVIVIFIAPSEANSLSIVVSATGHEQQQYQAKGT